MKKQLLTLLLISSTITFSQNGFYKSVYGNYGPTYLDKPILNSISKLNSNEGYIVTGAENPYVDYFCITKLDLNFNTEWTSSYEKSTGSSNYLEGTIELTDKSTVSYGIHTSKYILVRHDASGNLIHSNRYGSLSSSHYSTSAVCPSTLNDTGYVALFSECVVNFGLFKFDKNGDVEWSYEYGANGHRANVYEVDQALNAGYIATGLKQELIDDTTFYKGLILITKDDGTFNKSKKYAYETNEFNQVYLKQIIPDRNQNCYFAVAYYANDYSGIWNNSKRSHILQLDSNLNIMNNFEFISPDTNVVVRFANMATTADGKLVINGYFSNNVTSPSTQYYIMLFDPSVPGGEVVWCKTFQPLTMDPAWTSINTVSKPGLFTYGDDENILMAFQAHTDGSVIASIDINGEGLCNTSDYALSVALANNIVTEDNTMIALPHFVQPYPVPLTEYDEDHKDTTLCYINTLEAPVIENDWSNLVEMNAWNGQTSFQSRSQEISHFEIYNLNGQLVETNTIAPGEIHSISLNTGLYILIVRQNSQIQKEKIIVY